MIRRIALAALLTAPLLSVQAARAATFQPYTAAAFATALHNGTPVLVHVEASWCPTCRAQQTVLHALESDPRYASVEILDVDFDTQKDAVQKFGAQMQSTLIAYHAGKEAGRAVGVTSQADIETLLDDAVKG
ncbi:MAG: thioredoxin family protein [Acidocella sp.]|nr:thioredoxin family protein [Acidocella sp.]